MGKRIGKQTLEITSKPRIIATSSVVGPKEGEGPLKDYFDIILKDDLNGEDSFEKAESSILYYAISEAIKNANLKESQIDFLLAGDLLNQLTSANFAARDIDIPFIGLYGACSTMTESLSIASIIMDGGFANNVIAATSSHFSSAERQFRTPLEYGNQRPPSSQWTVTGSGAMILGKEGNFPYISNVTIGKVKDYNISDANNMGAAMAPAAVDTIRQHFEDMGKDAQDYDLIVTGDLGKIGKTITQKLLSECGINIESKYIDCGDIIFDSEKQNTLSGGSGCGCSAVVDCGYIYKNLMKKNIRKVLLVSTGALLSTTSSLQGESIPGIAHAVTVQID